MNVLVTGSYGQLGSWLRILAAGSRDNYIFTDVAAASDEQLELLRRLGGPGTDLDCERLDITDADAVASCVKDRHIDAIVNCAAFTDVDGAEDRRELAESLNATAVGILAGAAADNSALLVHVSTDYVFGKQNYNTPCTEEMKGEPGGVYGLTKLHGEQAVLASGCDYVILRTAWLYSEFGKNFLKTMMRLTGSRPEVSVVMDQVGTPTYAADLARAIVDILATYRTEAFTGGIFNYSDEGVCSWFDFAVTIARYAGNDACKVSPCRSSEFPSKVVRPSYSVLDKSKIKATYSVNVPYWADSLSKCMDNLKIAD